MKCRLTTIFFVVLLISAALAQQKKTVAPALKPTDEEPSLEETMKFIQDKLNDVGPVNFAQYLHDNARGTDSTLSQFKVEHTNVAADSGACRISYHHKMEADGSLNPGSDSWFPLNGVVDVTVIPLERFYKEANTASGHPGYDMKIDPPVFMLNVRGTDKKHSTFFFLDEQMANRVAKAMVRAVDLCGGGNKLKSF